MDLYTVTTHEILDRISRHCPQALSAYLLCINHADKKGTVFFSRETIETDMSVCWTKFKNNIKKLALENLLEWHPFSGGISITLADLEEND